MEEKTNHNGECSFGDSANISNEMPDVTGSIYSSDILSSVSENSISSYAYDYSVTSDALNNDSPKGIDNDYVTGIDSKNDMASDDFGSIDTLSQISSSGIYNQDTFAGGDGHSADPDEGMSEVSVKSDIEEAVHSPALDTYSYGTAGSIDQGSNADSCSYGGSVSSYSYGGDSSYDSNENKSSKTLGIVSMVFGILSLVCCCSGCVGMLMSAAAVICGIIHLAKKGSGKGFGIAGIITGALGLILSAVMLVVLVFMPDFNDWDFDYDYDYDYDYNYGEDYDYNYDEDYDYNYNTGMINYSDFIYGQWRIDSGAGTAAYILNEDGSWGWYKDYRDLSDNYYSGSVMEVFSGQEAFNYYGMDASELEHMETDSDRFFCFKLYVDTYICDGEDKSYQHSDPEACFSIALYMDEYDIDSAVLVNMDSADQYNVIRIAESASASDDLNFVQYSMYNGQADISLPDSWIYYGQQTTEEGTAYEAFSSASGMFEMYVTIQALSGSFADSRDFAEFCNDNMESTFGSENIYCSRILQEGDTTVIFNEAYNASADLHHYRSYDIYDGNYYTAIELYIDEDVMNEYYDVYSEYLDDIYESFVINY